jgi:chorismate-pyruvate lyase
MMIRDTAINRDILPFSMPADLTELSFFQKILMITDGTLTKLLESYVNETLQVVKLSEEITPAPFAIPSLVLSAGKKIIQRKILLQGTESRNNWLYADSLIVPDRLPEAFRDRLLLSREPIGKLWIEHKLETFKEIIASGIEPAHTLSNLFNIKAQDKLLCRTYLVFSGQKPIMMITEKFPESFFR